MKFEETKLSGVYLVIPQKIEDERGFFSRTWCEQEFSDQGLNPHLSQCNLSFNLQQGTLRGMHYQGRPYQEAKLVRCTMGAIYDVVIDLRPTSTTYLQWMSVELNAQNRLMLYIPEGLAHGFQTLCDNAEVFYQMSTHYVPGAARGVRWNDPLFKIEWPRSIENISDKDRTYADFNPQS